MAVKDMREVLEDVPFRDLTKEIRKLSLPEGVHVRVVIETLETPQERKSVMPDDTDLRFLEEVEGLPVAEDLPQDLAQQHDHYLYGLPKKS